jgi:hypothetical protein
MDGALQDLDYASIPKKTASPSNEEAVILFLIIPHSLQSL